MIKLMILLLTFVIIEQCLATGQFSAVDPIKLRDDPTLQEAFNEAVYGFNSKSNSLYSYAPYQVHSIQRQVVAGMLYRFEVTLLGTTCRNQLDKKENYLLMNCKPSDSSTPNRAVLQIVTTPWLEKKFDFKILSVSPITEELKLHDQLFVTGIKHGDLVSGLNFDSFKRKYNKIYMNEEEESIRFKILHQNFKKAMLMKILEKGSATYGITQFSDLVEEEFISIARGPAWDISKKPKKISPLPQDYVAPKTVDWRGTGAVSEVKNQQSCGSCWAFSTTGNVEGQWFLKMKQSLSLSEQQLVDCDTVDQGCNGGLPSQAYKQIELMGGLETESAYPYIARQQTCKLDKTQIRAYINDSVSLSTSESDMATWCSLNGPISIGINANAMQFYTGGISYPFSFLCNKNHLDHGVLIVGYSVTASNEPYWIIKNSWGAKWGEKGYYLVYRGAGVCGLNKMPTSAVVHPH